MTAEHWFSFFTLLMGGGIAMAASYLSTRQAHRNAQKQYWSRIQYEREIEFYKTLWPRLRKYYQEAFLRGLWKSSDSDAAAKSKALQQAATALTDFIYDNRPFFPKEVFDDLARFTETCDQLVSFNSRSHGLPPGKLSEELLQKLANVETKGKAEIKHLEDTIRQRYLSFEPHRE